MTPLDVRRRVAEVRAVSGDPEPFHAREDDLYVDVLTAIATGKATDPRLVAKAALRTRKIPNTERWYA